MTRMRPRGSAVLRCGRRTYRGGAAMSLADMTGSIPSGMGHFTEENKNNIRGKHAEVAKTSGKGCGTCAHSGVLHSPWNRESNG